ncbi:MAG: DRTGG domain-containing protein [Bacillota bacterium]
MKVREIAQIVSAKVLVGEDKLDAEIRAACGSDLMSDVLAYVNGKDLVLLTGLANIQVIRTAEVIDLWCILFVRGKIPPQHVLDLAQERGMVVMSTEYSIYEASGLLYVKDLPPIALEFERSRKT